MEILRKSRLPIFLSKPFSALARLKTIKSASDGAPHSKPTSQPTPLGLPLNLFVIYVVSSINSLILLLLSLLDLGYLSLWTIPPVSCFTLISHFAFPFLASAPRHGSAPSYFSTTIVCVYILAVAWFVASIAALVVAGMADKWEWNLDVLDQSGGAATVGTQIVQVLFSWIEVGLLVTFGVKGHRRIINKGEPESWRPPIPEQDKSMVGLSTVVFDSRKPNGGEDEGMKETKGSQPPSFACS
ncbi:hypothetical protein D9756_000353 [Leucocoprinus leucothites]|uniref:Uncharacterized protein n=1 Tax=Leucocoprinus leucothites TaxID=201217 RepID=A0A8H5GFH4_9AGAR|nr:hypothetical protein D9756_000353 [Leucoagaricus leucothites]